MEGGNYGSVNPSEVATLALLGGGFNRGFGGGFGGHGGYGYGGGYGGMGGHFQADGSVINANVNSHDRANRQGQECLKDILQAGQASSLAATVAAIDANRDLSNAQTAATRDINQANDLNNKFATISTQMQAQSLAAAECCCNIRREVEGVNTSIAQSEARLLAVLANQNECNLRDQVNNLTVINAIRQVQVQSQ